MSEHRASVSWVRKTPDFQYETYDRTHTIRFPGGHTMQASAAPEFAGKAEHSNPEEQLAAALASCHMLTFLAISAKSRLTVDRYEDAPVAHLDKREDGKMWVARVTLRPKVVFSGDAPDAAKLRELHDKAHRNCFIANSVKCAVTVEPSAG